MSTMRRTATLTAFLIGATFLVPGPATAVGETCRGETATIVGTTNFVQGTEGRDVIVTGSSIKVVAGSGDDLICFSTLPDITMVASVDAGPGNDVVDATGFNGRQSLTVLGAGADEFYGSPVGDAVRGGAFDTAGAAVPADNERDLIDSGDGEDLVVSTGGTVPNSDVIMAGSGADYLQLDGRLAVDGVLDGGPDRDTLISRFPAGSLAVDAGAQVASLDGSDWIRWSGIEHLTVNMWDGGSVAYAGTSGDDSVRVSAGQLPPSITATLQGGDDHLTVSSGQRAPKIAVDAGRGRDTVELLGLFDLRANLRTDLMRWGGTDGRLVLVENLSGYGDVVQLAGDQGRNLLQAGGCDVRVRGGLGQDTLERRPADADGPEVRCQGTRLDFDGGAGNDLLDGSRADDFLFGGAGDDRLVGRQGDDTLVGGQGRDSAYGGPDRDSCVAETSRACETR